MMFTFFKKRNKKVIYTAVFGNRDDLKPIREQKGYDYFVFTEKSSLRHPVFRAKVMQPGYEDPCRNARFVKINPHLVLPGYDYWIWVDANIAVEGVDFNNLLDNYLSHYDLALHKHPIRNCVYDEAMACREKGFDLPSKIDAQMNKYLDDRYPAGNGLCSTGILYRRNTAGMNNFSKLWWEEISAHSRRDQLSFNYLAWKYGFGFNEIPGHVRLENVDGFRIYPHNKPA
jgi:hypothetical protein